MEEKKNSVFRKISTVYFIWLGLYCAGMLLCRVTELEYRMWVWLLGNCSLFLGLPLWLFLFWRRRHVQKEGDRIRRRINTEIFALFFVVWSFFVFLFLIFGVEKERNLHNGYVEVKRTRILSPSYYECYKSRAFFFREHVKTVISVEDLPFYETENSEAAQPDVAEEIPESKYAKDARSIYETVLVPENIGEEFRIECDAKGREYYPLGEDGVYCYTLVYDRDSENGACRLYVLYRSPYDQENGSYYSYLDSMTQIMDIYAVVKETGQIIPSGKKAWSDVGSEEYRKAVGE